MTIDLSNCTSIADIVYAIILGVSILAFIVSGIGVYTNEKQSSEKMSWINEIFAGVLVFFTSSYLNSKGKKWRTIYISSAISLTSLIILNTYVEPCSAIT